MKFKQFYKENVMTKPNRVTLYRGKNNYNQQGHYWSVDKEFARNFTQSGLDKEIESIQVDNSTLLKLNPLPKATDDGGMDNAIHIGLNNGYKGIWVDEGNNQPNSVFIF
jgi:hypothetical protein